MLPKFEEIEGKTIIVEQIKSCIDCTQKQKANLKGLGVRRISSKSELVCTRDIYGMLIKVSHLITVKVK